VSRISLKLVTGRTVTRRFRRNDLVDSLFAFAATLISECGNVTTEFDIFTSYPTRSLLTCLGKTLDEVGVLGCQVIMRWL
jgi:UBX domain